MVLAYIELILGSVGRWLLEVYNDYRLVIHLAVMWYALGILYVHNNLRQLVLGMEKLMVELASQSRHPEDYERLYRLFRQVWRKQAQDKLFTLPNRLDIWFERLPAEAVLDHLDINTEYLKFALHKRLGKPDRTEFNRQAYDFWQGHRHSLLIGLRPRTAASKALELRQH